VCSSYYNGFKRTKDKSTRYCWQEKTCNFNIPQNLQIIRRLESGENQQDVMASYNTGSSNICDTKIKKDHL
jgi:hypothetical protein